MQKENHTVNKTGLHSQALKEQQKKAVIYQTWKIFK